TRSGTTNGWMRWPGQSGHSRSRPSRSRVSATVRRSSAARSSRSRPPRSSSARLRKRAGTSRPCTGSTGIRGRLVRSGRASAGTAAASTCIRVATSGPEPTTFRSTPKRQRSILSTLRFSDADLAYIRANYLTLDDLCAGRAEPPDQVRDLIEQRLLPRPSYVLDDGTGMFPADYFRLADEAGAESLRAHFAARHRAASLAEGAEPEALE